MTVVVPLPSPRRPREASPPVLTVRLDRLCTGVRVQVIGELDLGTQCVLADVLDTEPVRSANLLVLDLAGLTFADLAGLKPVLREWRRRRDDLLLLEPPPQIGRVLAALSLHMVAVRAAELPDEFLADRL